MTIQDLYNCAKENNALDKDLCIVDGERGGYIWLDQLSVEGDKAILEESNE